MTAAADDVPVTTAQPAPPAGGAPRRGLGSVDGALLRYRIVAWVVGVGLIVLVLIGVPLRYLADSPGVVAVVGPLHGFLFLLYLVLTADLALRCRWSFARTVLTMAAGTVPFLSFVAERATTRRIHEQFGR